MHECVICCQCQGFELRRHKQLLNRLNNKRFRRPTQTAWHALRDRVRSKCKQEKNIGFGVRLVWGSPWCDVNQHHKISLTSQLQGSSWKEGLPSSFMFPEGRSCPHLIPDHVLNGIGPCPHSFRKEHCFDTEVLGWCNIIWESKRLACLFLF